MCKRLLRPNPVSPMQLENESESVNLLPNNKDIQPTLSSINSENIADTDSSRN